ncbi:Oligopeptide-binding protein OppA precursor [compost metagenome]
MKTENQEWGVFIENRQNLNYQVARAGWTADYNDPMTFLDMWTSNSGNNDIGLKDAEYDKLINEAKTTEDNAKRNENFKKAEEILVKNTMGIMPIYYYTSVSVEKPYLKGVILDFSGGIDYTRAYLLEH